MASIKVKFLIKKILSDGTHPVAIQVIHNREKKLFYLKHSLTLDQWDEEENCPNNKSVNHKLLKTRIKSAINQIEGIILDLESKKEPFTVNDIERLYKPDKVKFSVNINFGDYVDGIIKELEGLEKFGNAKVYKNTKGVFIRFAKEKLGKEDIQLNKISEQVVKDFQADLVSRKVQVNGISFQLRTLRAILNRAIKNNLYEEAKYPFKNITIPSQKTKKRAVNKEVITSLENLAKSKDPYINIYKDLFLFSFYTRGMSFVDMAYLKVSNIENGRINYNRRKTGQFFSIKITDKIKAIILKYQKKKKPEDYLFPIIIRKNNEYLDYRNSMRLMNKKLKDISNELKLDVPLSSYVSRHSWATIAKRSGIATAVISEGLGHTTEEITQVYLDSFENDTLDAANELITG